MSLRYLGRLSLARFIRTSQGPPPGGAGEAAAWFFENNVRYIFLTLCQIGIPVIREYFRFYRKL
jgi:hypothetical protein